MKIKVGLKLKSEQNNSNIIVSLVLDMQKEFTINDVVNLTIKYLETSNIPHNKSSVVKCIRKELSLLEDKKCVDCINGKYVAVDNGKNHYQEEILV